MADNDALIAHAKAWFDEQDIPAACSDCDELKRWEVTQVFKVNRYEYDPKTDTPRVIEDPELYLVHVVCRQCGNIQSTYAEQVPL